jgi:prostatic aicd phosphatase
MCGNTQDRGCGELQLARSEGYADGRPSISPVGAGFVGAGITIGVFALAFAALFFLGFLTFGRRRSHKVTKEVRVLLTSIFGYQLTFL